MQPGIAMNTHGVGLEVYGRTDRGKVRESNEDAFVVADLMDTRPIHAMQKPLELDVTPRGVLLAVSDGLGGAQAGAVAGALTLQSLRRWMMGGPCSAAESTLAESVERADRRAWDIAASPGHDTSVTALLVDGRQVYAAEIGSARSYVFRGDSLTELSHDESYLRLTLDAESLTRQPAHSCPYRNVVAQAIGNKPDALVALNRFTLCRGDRLLLCSDGLTREVKEDEMRAILASTPILDAACARLIELASSRGGEDNITVLLAEASGDGLPAFSSEEWLWLETVQAFTD